MTPLVSDPPAEASRFSGRYQNWHQWRQVIHGPAALADLGGEMERLGRFRAVVVTTPSLVREAGVVGLVTNALGDRHVGTFGASRRGAPGSSVLAAARLAAESEADVLVSVGGGSVVDTAKGAALTTSFAIGDADGLAPLRVGARAIGLASPELPRPPLPIIAVPTTLSGAEYTGMIGITDEVTGAREPYRFDALAPETIVLDPRATVATPARLWGGTGVKALSDAFEQYATGTAGPAFDPQLLAAIRLFADQLLRSVGGDLQARLQCQIGAWLTLFATFNVSSRVGINAALRHQLGVRHGIAHGEASCPALAEVVRRTCPEGARGAALVDATESLDALDLPDLPDPTGVEARDVLAARLGALVRALGLPGDLRAAGLSTADVDALAELVVGDFANRHRSTRAWTGAEVGDLLRAAT
jgi:maleylacetate reductase